MTLVRELEPERFSEVQRGLAHVASRVTATTDLEMVIPELIHLLGGDGKALRALKMVSAGNRGFSSICLLAFRVWWSRLQLQLKPRTFFTLVHSLLPDL